MAKFVIDGLTYTDKLPHSRLERILYQILKKEGGGGDDDDAVVIDDPTDLGNGLRVSGNAITIDADNKMSTTSNKPITSNAVFEQLQLANTILERI